MKDLQLEINFNRINNDVNGNPRHVCHYLEFKPAKWDNLTSGLFTYNEALTLAKKLGGKKYNNKNYGGGVVFQSYNVIDDIEAILLQRGDAVKCTRKPTDYEISRGQGATHYRTFLKSDITKKDGTIKAWFKSDDDKLNYSTK